jgi:hypothetical protein
MALIDDLLPDLLRGVLDPLVASQSITITRRTGATGDPDDLSEYGSSPESQTLDCMAPWPYKQQVGSPETWSRDMEVAEAQTEISGRDPAFLWAPAAGMHCTIADQTWLIMNVRADLDADRYTLTLRRF